MSGLRFFCNGLKQTRVYYYILAYRKNQGDKIQKNFSSCHGRLRRQGKNGKEIAAASAKPRNDIKECPAAFAKITIIGVTSSRNAAKNGVTTEKTNRKFGVIKIIMLDLYVARAVNGFRTACGGFFTPILKIITTSGNLGLIFIVSAIIFLFFKKTRKAGISALIAVAIGAIITNALLKNVVARARPFADVDSEYYSFWKAAGSLAVSDYSFPSGHTTAAMAFGASLFLVFDKRYSWAFLLIPVLMGFTRIYFGVHYTTDVLGGMIVGGVAAIAAYFIVRLLCKNPKIKEFIG